MFNLDLNVPDQLSAYNDPQEIIDVNFRVIVDDAAYVNGIAGLELDVRGFNVRSFLSYQFHDFVFVLF